MEKRREASFKTKNMVRLYREILTWKYYTDPAAKIVFIHLLLTARYKAVKSDKATIARGETHTKVKELAEACGVSERACREALKTLSSTGEIKVRQLPRDGGLSIKIRYYDKYQMFRNKADKE